MKHAIIINLFRLAFTAMIFLLVHPHGALQVCGALVLSAVLIAGIELIVRAIV